jgi:hypothetical protein
MIVKVLTTKELIFNDLNYSHLDIYILSMMDYKLSELKNA